MGAPYPSSWLPERRTPRSINTLLANWNFIACFGRNNPNAAFDLSLSLSLSRIKYLDFQSHILRERSWLPLTSQSPVLIIIKNGSTYIYTHIQDISEKLLFPVFTVKNHVWPACPPPPPGQWALIGRLGKSWPPESNGSEWVTRSVCEGKGDLLKGDIYTIGQPLISVFHMLCTYLEKCIDSTWAVWPTSLLPSVLCSSSDSTLVLRDELPGVDNLYQSKDSRDATRRKRSGSLGWYGPQMGGGITFCQKYHFVFLLQNL